MPSAINRCCAPSCRSRSSRRRSAYPGGDDPRARGAELVDAGAQLGVEPFILEGQRRRGANCPYKVTLVCQVGVVDDRSRPAFPRCRSWWRSFRAAADRSASADRRRRRSHPDRAPSRRPPAWDLRAPRRGHRATMTRPAPPPSRPTSELIASAWLKRNRSETEQKRKRKAGERCRTAPASDRRRPCSTGRPGRRSARAINSTKVRPPTARTGAKARR